MATGTLVATSQGERPGEFVQSYTWVISEIPGHFTKPVPRFALTVPRTGQFAVDLAILTNQGRSASVRKIIEVF